MANEKDKVKVDHSEENLKDKVAQLEKELAESKKVAEEKALERVCSALGVEKDDVKKAEAKEPEPLRHYNLGQIVVEINGRPYTGSGQAPAGVVEVLMEAASKKRQRILREALGTNNVIESFAGGGFTSRVVGQIGQGEVQ